MVKTEQAHPVQWLAPSPLWAAALAADKADSANPGNPRFRRPALLRFASDEFMKELETAVQAAEPQLTGYVARFETHEAEAVGWENTPSSPRVLKLYQPMHARAYLVAAALVCRVAGLPDKTIHQERQEKAGFVIRRKKNGKEYGWVAAGAQKGWREVSPPNTASDDEERLPLFAINFTEAGRRRRLLAAYIPTASRETYAAGSDLTTVVPPGTGGEADPRLGQFLSRVISPWADLLGQQKQPEAAMARETSAYLFYDFKAMLQGDADFQPLWAALPAGQPANLPERLKPLYTALTTAIDPGDPNGLTLATGLLHFDLTSPAHNLFVERLWDPGLTAANMSARGTAAALKLVALQSAYAGGRTAYTPRPVPADQAPQLPKFDPNSGDTYVIRCVYDRRCELLHEKQLVSDPSVPFQIAPFYDPEAPAREIRIVMPADTSIAALRKYKKNVSVIVSDKLRNQLERIRGLKLEDVEKGNIGPPGSFSLGMICTLSIPIITICALILLIIILQILNIIFWWLPYVKVCFPINFKAKPS